MKKVLSLVFAALLSLAFVACDDTTEDAGSTGSTGSVCVPAPGEIC
jgi:uncharacterized lipoprotein YehR (DUF1307 family)